MEEELGSWGAAGFPGFWGESLLLPRLTGEGVFFGNPVSSKKALPAFLPQET